MEELRLPRNPKEGMIFGAVVAAISCLLIGGANIYLSVGPEDFPKALASSFIFVFIVAFLLSSFVVRPIAGKVVAKFYTPGDSVNSMLLINLVPFVLMMSAMMSILGPMAGELAQFIFQGTAFDVASVFENWINIWPRNFCIAFWVELLIAQPAGRRVMVWMHTRN